MLNDNRLWISDIDRIIEVLPELGELSGRSVLITGASGLICSAVADVLLRFNELNEKKIRIYVAGRNYEKMRSRFGCKLDSPELDFIKLDVCNGDKTIDVDADYIVHGAGNAYPSSIVQEPVETMLSNFMGMNTVLDYAKSHKTRRTLYISSSEVYGITDGNEPYKENEYGYVNILNFRNSYALAKRSTETLCISYMKEYGTDCVIVRPGHIYGPTAGPGDNRVSSAWSYKAAKGEDLVMKSEGTQLRSYCYCADCASAVLKVLLKGESGAAYNISNPDSIISIKRMAEIISEKAGVDLKYEIPDSEEKKGFNPMPNSSLDSTRLIELGWTPCFDAEEGFAHTIRILRDNTL